jgi:hypothetical protein
MALTVRQPDNSECGYDDCQKNKLHVHFFASLTVGTRLRHLTLSPFFGMRRVGRPSHPSPISSGQVRWRSVGCVSCPARRPRKKHTWRVGVFSAAYAGTARAACRARSRAWPLELHGTVAVDRAFLAVGIERFARRTHAGASGFVELEVGRFEALAGLRRLGPLVMQRIALGLVLA